MSLSAMKETRSIVWFRQDLRLKENPALEFAVSLGKVLPIYILDQENGGDWPPGKASRWLVTSQPSFA